MERRLPLLDYTKTPELGTVKGFTSGAPENRSCDLHGETGQFMVISITELDRRRNMQTNLKNTATAKENVRVTLQSNTIWFR